MHEGKNFNQEARNCSPTRQIILVNWPEAVVVGIFPATGITLLPCFAVTLNPFVLIRITVTGMPPTTDTRNPELQETFGDGEPFQVSLHDADASPAAVDLGPASNGKRVAPSIMHDTVKGPDGMDAGGARAGVSDPAPAASPLADDRSDEEMGAFDDSHLQVDQPKKKKKKKNRKPKSKRGLVIRCCVKPMSADPRIYRMLPPGSKSTVRMHQSRPPNMTRRNSFMTREPPVLFLRVVN